MNDVASHAAFGLDDVDHAAADLATHLSDELRPLARIAYNYRWSWEPGGPDVFADIDADRWRQLRHNPVRLLAEASPTVLAAAAADPDLVARTRRLGDVISADLARPVTPDFDAEHPIAFLCAEFGLHESLPLYSGGLGVLAGDIVKESSDLALPMLAVGLFYHNGYFRQRLDHHGWQIEWWDDTDTAVAPMVPVRDGDRQLTLTVPVRGTDVVVQVWRVQVGRVPLYLLDTDLPANPAAHRWTTARLYDGNPEVRLAQYTVLGIGAIRLLRRLGVDPSVLHLNEGHAALAPLELAAEQIEAGAGSFRDVRDAIRDRCVFTTHTPVAAGNETYPPATLLHALPGLADRLGLDHHALLDLGRVRPEPHHEAGMTPIALRMSRRTNAVSRRHGQIARAMWNDLWPGPVDDVPITHVTNGIHLPTWMGSHVRALLDRHLGVDWWRRADDPTVWEGIDAISDHDLWAARQASRADLVQWVVRRSAIDRLRRGEALDWAVAAARALDPDALTLGFARRVASYKRLHLLTHDVDRLIRLLSGDRPVQLLIAGKAHPRDDGAKAMVRDLFGFRGSRAIAERVVFVEDYDIEVGRLLTTGCDVWLNVPRPPLEASGTSGMKVVLNGGLNLSVLDGWWAEGYDGTNGWGIDGAIDDDHGRQDHEHARALLDTLEKEVVPTFYDRDDDGLPARWLTMMRASLSSLGPRFAARRMMHDYAARIYPGAP